VGGGKLYGAHTDKANCLAIYELTLLRGIFCFNKQFLICNYSSITNTHTTTHTRTHTLALNHTLACTWRKSARELFLMKMRMQTYYAYEALHKQPDADCSGHKCQSMLILKHTHTRRYTCIHSTYLCACIIRPCT